jgi:hypothetical protein
VGKLSKEVNYKDNILFISDKKIEFQYNILQIQKNERAIFVALDIPMDAKLGENEVNNVFSFNYSGKMIWRVKNILPQNTPEYKRMPFEVISLVNDQLYATDFVGRRCEVNQLTGNLRMVGSVK